MKLTFGKALAGLSLGVLLTFSPVVSQPANASPFGAVRANGEVSALPLVDVQVRRAARRPARPVRRAGRGNGGLAAGALIGAAILGGAIIANSQRRERVQQQYYYTPDGYLVDAYGNPVQQRPQPVYRQQPQYQYYGQPQYQPEVQYAPRQRRQIIQSTEGSNPGYAPVRPRYQPQGQPRIVYTPDKETPYHYVR